MRQSVALLACLLLVLPCLVFAQDSGKTGDDLPPPRVLRFIFDSKSPPFAFKEGDKDVGFDIELGEGLGKELEAEIKWIDVPFNIREYANLLEDGSADAAMAAISITKVRKYFVDFTRPYFTTTLAVATRPEVTWDERAFARGLENKVVGVMKGTTAEEWARKNLKAIIKEYDSPLTLVRALKEGGNLAFAVVIDLAILDYLRFQGTTEFKIVEKGFSPEDYGIAVSNGNSALVFELNTALSRLETGGAYDKIYKKWFGKK